MSPAVDWDEERGTLPWQFQFFTVQGGKLEVSSKSEATDLFGPLTSIRSLSDIEAAVQDIPKVDWMWIDLQLGYELAVEDPDLPRWDEDQVWASICQPWSGYLRLSGV